MCLSTLTESRPSQGHPAIQGLSQVSNSSVPVPRPVTSPSTGPFAPPPSSLSSAWIYFLALPQFPLIPIFPQARECFGGSSLDQSRAASLQALTAGLIGLKGF